MKLARAHGIPFREYMQRISARDLAEQAALEEVVGPLGDDRADWRAAWLAYWIVTAFTGTKANITPVWFFSHWLETLRNRQLPEVVIVEDDPDATARKAKELEAKVLAAFPKAD